MIGPSDLLSALQNGVVAIRDLTTTISEFFPKIGSVNVTAPSTIGTVVFTSSLASGYLLVTTSSGAQYKMPLYPL